MFRIAAQIGAQPAFGAQVVRKIGAEIQPVAITVVAQPQGHAFDGQSLVLRSRAPIHPQQVAALDHQFVRREQESQKIRIAGRRHGGGFDAGDPQAAVRAAFDSEIRFDQHQAVDHDTPDEQRSPGQAQAHFLQVDRRLAGGRGVHTEILYPHTGIEAIPKGIQCTERDRIAGRAAQIRFDLTLAFGQRRQPQVRRHEDQHNRDHDAEHGMQRPVRGATYRAL